MESFRTSDGRTLAYNVLGQRPDARMPSRRTGLRRRRAGRPGRAVCRRGRWCCVDPRGTGAPIRRRDYSLDGYAADLDELRAHLGLERMDLLGFSHGAVVAIHYAARYPDGLDRLVLAGGLAAFTDEVKAFAEEYIESKAGEPWHDDAVDALAEEENGEIDDLAGAVAARGAALLRALGRELPRRRRRRRRGRGVASRCASSTRSASTSGRARRLSPRRP